MVVETGKMNIKIEDALEEAFRRAAFEVYGYRKGAIQTALEEAMKEWLKNVGKAHYYFLNGQR